MGTSLKDLLTGVPDGPDVPAAEVAAREVGTGRVFVVLDDDPTGTQSVADLPVLTDWSVDSLEWALRQGCAAAYVMTNSRSLSSQEAERRNREVVRNAFAAAERIGLTVDFVSRSDSTLRGHFPLEPRVLAEEVAAKTGGRVDGVVIVPAFGDAGRITVHGIHYAGNKMDGFDPVGESEFARDATFGYRASDLREWVEEKTGGQTTLAQVAAIDITTLRTDHHKTVATLADLSDRQPVIVDIVNENDLRLLALALAEAEAAGTRLLYRVGPPFVRARIGQEPRRPLEAVDIARIRTGGVAAKAGGLVVVGSHVQLTTRQLAHLIEHDHPVEVELDVRRVVAPDAEQYLGETCRAVDTALSSGNAVLRTSRELITGTDPEDSLAISRRVSSAVVEVVRRVVASGAPRFVVAKGGITSSDVASRGLGIGRAMARGPVLAGIVSLWEPMEGPARGVPYVVFPGNVGGDSALTDVVAKLSLP